MDSVIRRLRITAADGKNYETQLVTERANPAQPNMGLTNWKGGAVRNGDVTVAKNYLYEKFSERRRTAIEAQAEQDLIRGLENIEKKLPKRKKPKHAPNTSTPHSLRRTGASMTAAAFAASTRLPNRTSGGIASRPYRPHCLRPARRHPRSPRSKCQGSHRLRIQRQATSLPGLRPGSLRERGCGRTRPKETDAAAAAQVPRLTVGRCRGPRQARGNRPGGAGFQKYLYQGVARRDSGSVLPRRQLHDLQC